MEFEGRKGDEMNGWMDMQNVILIARCHINVHRDNSGNTTSAIRSFLTSLSIDAPFSFNYISHHRFNLSKYQPASAKAYSSVYHL